MLRSDEYDKDTEQPVFHYVYIKNVSRLVSDNLSNRKKKRYICDRCLHFFFNEQDLKEHEEQCSKFNACKICLSKKGKGKGIDFKNYKHKGKLPFIIYADCECFIKPVQEEHQTVVNESEVTETIKNSALFQRHEIYSIGFYLKCSFNDSLSTYKFYIGSDAGQWFAKELKEIENFMINYKLYNHSQPMEILTVNQVHAFYNRNICHICNEIKSSRSMSFDWKISRPSTFSM